MGQVSQERPAARTTDKRHFGLIAVGLLSRLYKPVKAVAALLRKAKVLAIHVCSWLWRSPGAWAVRLSWLVPPARWLLSGAILAIIGAIIAVAFKPSDSKLIDFLLINLVRIHWFAILSGGLALLVVLAFAYWGSRLKERDLLLQKHFLLAKQAKDLTPADFRFGENTPAESLGLHERPFFPPYLPRRIVEWEEASAVLNEEESTSAESGEEFSENDLADHLRAGRSFVLLGPIGRGKTTTILHIFKLLANDGCIVLQPELSAAVPERRVLNYLKGRKVAIVVDDLHEYVKIDYDLRALHERLTGVTGESCAVAIICRTGKEWEDDVANAGGRLGPFLEGIQLRLLLLPMPDEQKRTLNEQSGNQIDWETNKQGHYLEPLQITMGKRLLVMEERYANMAPVDREVLQCLKLLDTGGIPYPSHGELMAVLNGVFQRRLDLPGLRDSLEGSGKLGLVRRPWREDPVHPEPGYLLYVVVYRENTRTLDDDLPLLAEALDGIKDTDGLLALQEVFFRNSYLSRSLDVCDRIIRFAPNCADAHYRRAFALAGMSKLEEALEANKIALTLRAHFPQAHKLRGYTLLKMGSLHLDEALKEFDTAISQDPTYFQAYTNKAHALANVGRLGEALDVIRRSVQFSTKSDDDVYLSWCRRLSRLGRSWAAKGEYDEAVAASTIVIELRPDYAEAYLDRGRTWASRGEYDKALVDETKAIELRPDLAEAYLNRGRTWASKGEYDTARDDFTTAVQLRPDLGEAYLHRGQMWAAQGEHDKALDDIATANKLRPDLAKQYLGRGKSRAFKGEYDFALDDFSKAIDLRSDYAEAYFNRGRTWAAKGEHDNAIADFERANELSPSDAHSYPEQYANLNSRSNEALVDCDRTIELRPSDPQAYRLKSTILAAQTDYDMALAAAREALRLKPDYAEAFVAQGTALSGMARQKRREEREKFLNEALFSYQEAARCRPKWDEAYRQCGFILGLLGRDKEALVAYQHACDLNSSNDKAVFGKAVALAYLCKSPRGEYSETEHFPHILELLERAITQDPSFADTARKLSIRSNQAFSRLRDHSKYGQRFSILVGLVGRTTRTQFTAA